MDTSCGSQGIEGCISEVDHARDPESLSHDSVDGVNVQNVSAREQESKREATEKVLQLEVSMIHVDIVPAMLEL